MLRDRLYKEYHYYSCNCFRCTQKLIRKYTMGFLFWCGFYFESFLSLKTCCLCVELIQVQHRRHGKVVHEVARAGMVLSLQYDFGAAHNWLTDGPQLPWNQSGSIIHSFCISINIFQGWLNIWICLLLGVCTVPRAVLGSCRVLVLHEATIKGVS